MRRFPVRGEWAWDVDWDETGDVRVDTLEKLCMVLRLFRGVNKADLDQYVAMFE